MRLVAEIEEPQIKNREYLSVGGHFFLLLSRNSDGFTFFIPPELKDCELFIYCTEDDDCTTRNTGRYSGSVVVCGIRNEHLRILRNAYFFKRHFPYNQIVTINGYLNSEYVEIVFQEPKRIDEMTAKIDQNNVWEGNVHNLEKEGARFHFLYDTALIAFHKANPGRKHKIAG